MLLKDAVQNGDSKQCLIVGMLFCSLYFVSTTPHISGAELIEPSECMLIIMIHRQHLALLNLTYLIYLLL